MLRNRSTRGQIPQISGIIGMDDCVDRLILFPVAEAGSGKKKTYQLLLPVTLSLTELPCRRRKVPIPGFVTSSTPLEQARDPEYNGRHSFWSGSAGHECR